MTLHRFLLVTHRWIGIVTAAFLVLLGGTGALLVYQPQLERMLGRRLYHVEPAAERLPLDSIVAAAQRVRPGQRPVAIHMPEARDVAARVQFGFRLVFVDPYRGTVQGERGMGESLVGRARGLHTSLLAGSIGRTVLVLASLSGLLLTIGGVVLWWPRRIVWVHRTRSWRGVNFDLHNALGILSSLGITILSGTIVLRSVDPVLDPLYRRALGDGPAVRLLPRSTTPPAVAPSLDSLVRAGDVALPGPIREVRFPRRAGEAFRLLKANPDGSGSRARNVVFLDPADGRILGTIDHARLRLGTRMYDLIEDWHTMAIYGAPTRAAGLVACLLLVFQSISGPLIWWKPRRRRRTTAAASGVRSAGAAAATLVLAMLLPAARASAQDPFEIQVYEYETVPRGLWNLETHLNYTLRGTRAFDGPVAPTRRQTHLTFELTRGITNEFEMAGYLVLAHRPGAGAEYAGWRLRPRVRAPAAWNLPVGLSLSAEVGFPTRAYESARTTLELRPIIEKRFGRTQVDLNPVIGRALRGPGVGEGWDFEPGARIGWTASPRLDLSLEYYGAMGRPFDPLPVDQQVHQLYPGVDINLDERTVLNLGVGVGMTDVGNRTVLKLRLGKLFGG